MTALGLSIERIAGGEIPARLPQWREFLAASGAHALSRDPAWLLVFEQAFRHQTCYLEATAGGSIVGLLPLAFVRSALFGRFLVSLPYLNTGGLLAQSDEVAGALIDSAVEMADSLDVRYLELRHEQPVSHPALGHCLTHKMHMRLRLPRTSDSLWKSFDPKVRNQIRKAEKQQLSVAWGGPELLDEFYAVFAENMRDLGTPVFGRRLFACILAQFPSCAELCVVRMAGQPTAAGLLIHGAGVSEIPSASSLRRYNATNANMLLYWHLLQRSISRGQQVFDFGRSSPDSGTFRFKRQWGAEPEPAAWQYYLRKGTIRDMRPDNARFQPLIAAWRRLPVRLTRLLGPPIVRGIP
jgi:FemAB-related protein (PEP-CTERM system-associated)